MIYLIIKVVLASIVVSVISYALRLIPRYTRRVHRVLQQILNTGLLTLILTYVLLAGLDPGWIVTTSMIFLALIVSIIITNFIAHSRGRNPASGKNL